VPHNWHACRGTELGIKGHRIEAHLLILATFRDLPSAKAVITYMVALVYGAEAQEARRTLGIVKKYRLFSEGAIALTAIVDEALDARSALGDDGEVGGDTLAAIGEWLFEVGLVEVNGAGDLVDGPRIRSASAALKKQHPSDHSEALKSLASENVLLVWLNFVLSDAEMRARVPEMVLSSRLNDKTKPLLHSSSRAGLRPLLLGRLRHGRAVSVPGPPGELLGRWRRPLARVGVVVVSRRRRRMESYVSCVMHCALYI